MTENVATRKKDDERQLQGEEEGSTARLMKARAKQTPPRKESQHLSRRIAEKRREESQRGGKKGRFSVGERCRKVGGRLKPIHNGSRPEKKKMAGGHPCSTWRGAEPYGSLTQGLS